MSTFKWPPSGGSNSFSSLVLNGNTSGSVTFTVPATVSPSYTLTLPNTSPATNQFLQSDSSGNLNWVNGTGGSGVTTVGTYDSQSPATNGATISSTSIYFQSASGTKAGMVNTGSQTFAGNKTFNTILFSSLLSTSANISNSGSLALSNTDLIGWRNSGNNADITLGITGCTLFLPPIASPSSDTLVARNTTDILTNKTIAATSNTITGLTNSNLSGTAGITAANLVQTDITSLGTITTGIWHGSIIGSIYGGTGVNNGSNTITLAGNLVTSGTNSLTLTTTGATNVTLPITGTLVNTAVTTLSSLVSVGTITTGVWQGSVIGSQYGGTGVNNSSSTITLGGNLATSGAFSTTLTVTGNTNVTLPTSGTLVNTSVTTLSSLNSIGTITTGIWNSSTPIAILYGGTGQTTALAAFNALSPVTTTGDMIYSSSGTTNSRLAIGSSQQSLIVSGGVPAWSGSVAASWGLAGTQSLSSNILTTVLFDTKDFDTNNVYNSGTGVITVPFAGVYQISAIIEFFNSITATSTIQVIANRNSGIQYKTLYSMGFLSGPANCVGGICIFNCAANDTIQVQALQGDIGSNNIGSTVQYTNFSFSKVR